MNMEEYFRVAKIAGTHALKGDLKIVITTDFPKERFKVGNALKLLLKNKQVIDVKVKKFQYYKSGALLGFEGYTDINDVDHFKGGELYIHKDERDKLSNDEYYQSDLIGCECTSTEGEILGNIIEIIETGAHEVLIIKKDGNKDLLVPFNKEYVTSVNIITKKITIQMIEGLRDEN